MTVDLERILLGGPDDSPARRDTPLTALPKIARNFDEIEQRLLLPFPGLTIPVRPSRFYLPVTIVDGSGTNAVAANTVYYLPHYLPRQVINRIAIGVTSGAAGLGQVALFEDDGSGAPGDLIVAGGTVDTTNTGTPEASIDPIQLPDGLFWAAAVFNATPTLRNGTPANTYLIGAGSLGSTIRGYSATFTYGEFPDAAPLTSLISSGSAPIIALRMVP